jgi:hypothetical protein
LFALLDARDWTVFIGADEDADGSIHCLHQPLGTADAPLGDAHTRLTFDNVRILNSIRRCLETDREHAVVHDLVRLCNYSHVEA